MCVPCTHPVRLADAVQAASDVSTAPGGFTPRGEVTWAVGCHHTGAPPDALAFERSAPGPDPAVIPDGVAWAAVRARWDVAVGSASERALAAAVARGGGVQATPAPPLP